MAKELDDIEASNAIQLKVEEDVECFCQEQVEVELKEIGTPRTRAPTKPPFVLTVTKEEVEQNITLSRSENYYILLERCRVNKLKVNYRQYLRILFLSTVFYLIPAVQLAHSNVDPDDPDDPFCYHNFKCANQLGPFRSFNNVISNVFYVIVGVAFVAYVKSHSPRRSKMETRQTGLIVEPHLFYSLGWSLVFAGIFSAIYHLCPSPISFQFDSAFITVAALLCFVVLYSKRHRHLIGSAERFFFLTAVLMVLIAISLWPNAHDAFWSVVLVFYLFFAIPMSFNIYHHQPPMISKLIKTTKILWSKRAEFSLRNIDWSRAGVLIAINVLNILFTIFNVISGNTSESTDSFPIYLMAVIVVDFLLYFLLYIGWKMKYKERIFKRPITAIVFMIIFMIVALYFFRFNVTNKLLEPEESKALNKPCVFLDYFDTHDLWHFFSALCMGCTYLALYWIDFDLYFVPQNKIAVF